MKVHNAVVALGALALLVVGTAAQDEPIKIGVVDLDQAISSTEDGKAAREEMARKQREAEAQIAPLYERYQALDEDLKAKKFVLSDESLFQKQLDMAEVRNQIENKVKEIEGQLKVDKFRIQEPLLNKLRQIINETGRDQGFTLILQRGAAGVIYTREALDITDLIIAQYNKK
ncbi:MAG TPA: OmpH family outer membrane protein [Myxococcota bacterium]